VTYFSDWAYLVAGMSAFFASACELGNLYRRWPFCNRKFAYYWFGIALLDTAAGCLAIAICSILKLARNYSWLGNWYGWVVIGLSATLVMRANFKPVKIGNASVPIGTGTLYAGLRTLLEKPLKGKNWQIQYALVIGRLNWSLDFVDNAEPSVSMKSVCDIVRSFIPNNFSSEDVPKEVADLEIEIRSAKRNKEPVEQVKQLITYMVEKEYNVALDALLGPPNRNVIRGWRTRSAIASVPAKPASK
jgi:hypothetical protein